jgi:dehydrogenase/reductase SDR family protein 12
MVVREVIEVSAPLAEAFAYVADFETAAEWDPGIVESRRTSAGPVGVGTTYDVVAEFRGKHQLFHYRVTEYVDGERLVLDGEGARATSLDTIVFEPTTAGTRIAYEAEFHLKGVYRLAEPFLGGTFRALGAKALAGLKSTLEAR